ASPSPTASANRIPETGARAAACDRYGRSDPSGRDEGPPSPVRKAIRSDRNARSGATIGAGRDGHRCLARMARQHPSLRHRGPRTGPRGEEPVMSQADQVPTLYGGPATRRVRTRDLLAAKERGEKWAMLTSYDQYTASIFDQAGIPVLLVGDSAANNVYGYETTLSITPEELLPLVRAVVRSTRHALVVGDLPFGSYEGGAEQGLATGVRFMKEGGCHAVKLEGGRRCAPQIAALARAGVPVMAHIGFTPQSEHQLGGYRVQGRGEAADEVIADAVAGAFPAEEHTFKS